MAENSPQTDREAKPRPAPIRLPNFAGSEQIGLGDIIGRATTAMHVKQCGGCARRAEFLNRMVVFDSRHFRGG